MDTRTLLEAAASERERARRSGRNEAVFAACIVTGLLAFVIGLAALVYFALTSGREAHARFMRQCMKDHKEYECTALWRAEDRSAPDVLVLPIPLPSR